MSIRLSGLVKFGLLCASAAAMTACTATKYTAAEQEMVETMGASQYQPRTQLERDAVETQDLFAQTAFWSREYDLNPGDLEAAIKLSSTLRKMGNPGQALEIAKTARALHPKNTDLLAEYAAGLIALEKGKNAIAPLSQAVRRDPRNARLWSLLGASHDQIGQFTKGREYYGRALALAPNDSNILANVGLSYALEGDARTAEIWLRRAAQNPKASAHVRQNLALVLGLQGKYSEAESLAREDLDADGAENNLAYLKALRGGGRTYEALEAPSVKAAAPRAASPAQSRIPVRPKTAPAARPAPPHYQTQIPAARASQNYMPRTAPNISTGQGGAREAAMAAAKRMQANGGAQRSMTVPAQDAAAQQDVLSKIGQSVAPKRAPVRPTYAQMQARAAQLNQEAQMRAQAEAQAAREQARRTAGQYTPAPRPNAPQGYGQSNPYAAPAPYGTQPAYRAPARRRQ